MAIIVVCAEFLMAVLCLFIAVVVLTARVRPRKMPGSGLAHMAMPRVRRRAF